MNIKLLLPSPCKNSKTALQKRGFSTFQSDTYVKAKFAINKCSNLIKQLLVFNTLCYMYLYCSMTIFGNKQGDISSVLFGILTLPQNRWCQTSYSLFSYELRAPNKNM